MMHRRKTWIGLVLSAVMAGLTAGTAAAAGSPAPPRPMSPLKRRKTPHNARIAWPSRPTGSGRSNVWDAAADSPEAIAAALGRAERLIASLDRLPDRPDLGAQRRALVRLRQQAAGAATFDAARRGALYRDVRWVARKRP